MVGLAGAKRTRAICPVREALCDEGQRPRSHERKDARSVRGARAAMKPYFFSAQEERRLWPRRITAARAFSGIRVHRMRCEVGGDGESRRVRGRLCSEARSRRVIASAASEPPSLFERLSTARVSGASVSHRDRFRDRFGPGCQNQGFLFLARASGAQGPALPGTRPARLRIG